MTFNDPRIEYQKLIDQSHRFFLTVAGSGFSLLIIIAGKNEYALGMGGAALLTMLCFIWRVRTYLLINKLKAVCEFNKKTNPDFRDFIELEEKIVENDKVSKGWKGKIDTLVPLVAMMMASGALAYFTIINMLSKFGL